MEEKKRNFFIDIWTSIKDFEGYEEFAADKVTKAIKYLVLITFIFTIAVCFIYTYKFYFSVNDIKSQMIEKIEDIKFENRKIAISSRYAAYNSK